MRATQASIAVSADGENWFLINASPDLRQQITATPQLHPRAGELRHSPIAGVILTNAEVDAVAGLLSLREGSPFTIYAHRRVLSVLAENSIFNVLKPDLVKREPVAGQGAFEPRLQDGRPSGLTVEVFAVPGKGAWYLEGMPHPGGEPDEEGDTIGLHIRETNGSGQFFFIAACAGVTPELKARLEGAPLVFFDGTLWTDDEMIRQGLSQKSGQRMGHIANSGPEGAIAALANLGIGRKVFLHINNSNPVLRPESAERREAETAGWEVAQDGMEITL